MEKTNDIGLDEILEEQDMIRAKLCRDNFYYFLQEFWGEIIQETPVLNWHVEYICRECEKVGRNIFLFENNDWTHPKEGGRGAALYDFLVNISPGTTKSTIMSQMFPAWCWANDPTLRFITASYAQKVANEQADACRQIMRSEKYRRYFKDVRIRKDADNKENFKLEYFLKDPLTGRRLRKAGGQRLSTSCGGSIMGIHAHIIIIDDPLDPKGADGATLETTLKWMKETIPSRVVSKKFSVMMMVMQRIHEDDPSALWIKQQKKGERKLRHVCLPCEVSKHISPAVLKKFYDKAGGYFDSERLGKEEIMKQRASLGPYAFAGQFMQTPVPDTGAMFNAGAIKIVESIDRSTIQQSVRYWDKAGSYNSGAYTVGLLMHRLKVGGMNRWVVADIVRGQWEAAQREQIIKRTAEMDGQSVTIYVEQEGGSGGKESAQHTISNLAGFNVMRDVPTSTKTGDAKAVRAGPFAGQLNAGNVDMLKGNWNMEYISELRHFPNGTYKDQVDASSGAFNKLTIQKVAGVWGTGRLYGRR